MHTSVKRCRFYINYPSGKCKRCTMEFFYILTIIYHVNNVQVDIPLNSSAECDRVIRTLEHLSADLFCRDTGKLSQSIKPKLRD